MYWVIMPKCKRIAYDAAFKLKVKVNEKLVCDWRKKKEQLVSCTKTLEKIRCTPSQYAELEIDLNS